MSSFAEITEAVSHIHKAHNIQVQLPSRSISSVLSCLIIYREDLPTLCWIQKGFWRQDTLLCVMETQKPLSQRRAQDREERGWLNLLTICDPGLHDAQYDISLISYIQHTWYIQHISCYNWPRVHKMLRSKAPAGTEKLIGTGLPLGTKPPSRRFLFKIIFFREKILNKTILQAFLGWEQLQGGKCKLCEFKWRGSWNQGIDCFEHQRWILIDEFPLETNAKCTTSFLPIHCKYMWPLKNMKKKHFKDLIFEQWVGCEGKSFVVVVYN